MPHFTDEQLAELEAVFGIKRQDSFPVRDGRVTRDSMVWWRGVHGPEHIKAGDDRHWGNIESFPDVCQIAEPIYRITYVED
ncbi:MAG TPA: hypothetical protein VF534_17815 [Paraburkholderia sp.]